ncbi:unnamed protein product [Acanthoscelides obtectus]|uniref:Retrotransposon gag domain-containing protein n=1 Tax=Acanthoscelides obtectus TaxID=200917 RepID=A0A9P0PKS0_ACAOB|nr:unnamed protein product [Acanthoscelides obtectus]CAK1672457.1 hypothetical protein AOBTE_LOCUS28909 [Acanthoscelides obtectus]
MEELTSVLTAVLRGIQQPPQQAAAAPVVPAPSAPINIQAFDPSKSDAGAMGWCDDMETLATTFKWTDFEQLCRAAGALEGDAKDWYDNWHPSNKVWASLRAELCQLYPAKRNLSERLRKASMYRSDQATGYWHKGNEKAVELAPQDAANRLIGSEPFCGVTRTRTKQSMRNWTKKKSLEWWNSQLAQSQAKEFIKEERPAFTGHLLGFSRKVKRPILGLFTGERSK